MKPPIVPAGAAVYLGAPAQPMDPARRDAIARLLARAPGPVEAHLPQFYCQKVDDKPAQILVLVMRQGFHPDQIHKLLEARPPAIVPEGESLDVWTMDDSYPPLKAVRNANCRIV
jgi:hypothetical protein